MIVEQDFLDFIELLKINKNTIASQKKNNQTYFK